MSEFGSCSEPLCHETSVRLFDCIHHCKRPVCLQHLIEHDRTIEHHRDSADQHRLRTELKQLWLTYSSLVDETTLRVEFEEKLNQHQQLVKEISTLFEMNSTEIERYRSMIEKVKVEIEQEKPDDLVKIEPREVISTNEEIDMLDMSLATRLRRLHSNPSQQQQQSTSSHCSSINASPPSGHTNIDSPSVDKIGLRTFSCECPFGHDGAFGLREDGHGIFHKLKRTCADQICRALLAGKDPSTEILFQSTDIVIDEKNNYLCPFSIHNTKPSAVFNAPEYSCRRMKPELIRRFRRHFIRDHHMTPATATTFVKKLKQSNSENNY